MVYPHYDVSSAGTSDSGGDMNGSGSAGTSSVRSVSLTKRHGFSPHPSLGFSIRGGHEHGTGFFISAVEKGSEAHCQGLKVGDQIIRVNGFPVEDATHRELLQLIQNQTTVNLKVRSVGMLPVKDSFSESLTWRLVEPSAGLYLQNHNEAFNHVGNHNFPRSHGNVVVTMDVPPKATLGCGICKGPEWKPGIFVQFTKENGLAREAGLRPGDQILQCNNVDFTNITFNEAVSVLRGSGRLVLLVKKGAGAELFPGESSGYNSSASSVAGDQSPETWVNKRLSIVNEESFIDSDSRLSHHDSDHRLISDQYSNESSKDRLSKVYEPNCNVDIGKTVIHVSSSDNSSQRDKSVDYKSSINKLTEICMVSQQMETTTTTVLVEVHQNNEESDKDKSDQNNKYLEKSSSGSSFSGSSMTSLSSAISQEIQRRSERKASDPAPADQSPQKECKLEKLRSSLDKEKVIQHEQLMQEFKRAHRKMFSPPGSQDSQSSGTLSTSTQSKLERNRKESTKAAFHYFENGAVNNSSESNADVRIDSRLPNQPPPPPPPLPSDTSSGSSKEFSISETIPSTHHIIGPPTPPDCPTPDYDSLSLASINDEARRKPCLVSKMNGKNPADAVEMQSIESFKLTNPSAVKPKPPSTYFVPTVKVVPNNNSNTSQRPSSNLNGKPAVTIREYPSSMPKKQPSRMEFLPKSGETISDFPPGSEAATRLQTELFQTLSRSNLNKRFMKPEANSSEKGSNVTSSVVKGNKVTISINPQAKCSVDSGSNGKSNQNPFYLFPNKNKCLKTEELSDRLSHVNVTNSNLHNGHSNVFVIDKSALKSGQAILKMNSKSNCDSNKNSVTFNFSSKRAGDSKSSTDSKTGAGLCSILKNGSATNTTNVSKVQIKN